MKDASSNFKLGEFYIQNAFSSSLYFNEISTSQTFDVISDDLVCFFGPAVAELAAEGLNDKHFSELLRGSLGVLTCIAKRDESSAVTITTSYTFRAKRW